jgi:uncharacterized membrane protein YgcG
MNARLLAALGLVGCMGAPLPQDLGETQEAVATPGSLASDFVPYPADVPRSRPPIETVVAACPAPIVLFVNFDGGQLTGGQQCNNSSQRCSFIVSQTAVNFPAFAGTAAQKQQIITLVTQYFAPFNVQIVTTAPTAGAYEMSMVGGTPQAIGLGAGAAGVAPLDCGNTNAYDISFAFSDVTQNNPHDVATTIAQEAAHAFGLGHVNNNTDIMYPALSPNSDSFHNQSFAIYDIGGGPSSDCTGTGQQNDVTLLNANVGAACNTGTGGTGGTGGAGGSAGAPGGGGAGGAGGSSGAPGSGGSGGSIDPGNGNNNPSGGNTSGNNDPHIAGNCAALPGSATGSLGMLSLLLVGLVLARRVRK